ncbi:hypothetical protein FRC09_011128, partial [Ceratobasidium sp. 395]
MPGAEGWTVHEYFGNSHDESHTCCGVGTLKPGMSSKWEYPGYQYAIVLSGDGELVDAANGQTEKFKTGDICHIDKGTNVTWKAGDAGLH